MQKSAAKNAAATPMMVQYHEVKAKHPDFLLFYRMGDFFELFFDDAVQASTALGIQLTKRGKHDGGDIPMCGVPVSRADEYLHKLIKKGFRVAVAEQLEDPEIAKKRGPKSVVRRDVVRLVTPGTLTEDALLAAANNNFLTAIVKAGREAAAEFALASVDISTGEFLLSAANLADLEGELLRLRPAEVLCADDENDGTLMAAIKASGVPVTALARACFSEKKGERALKEAFQVAALDGIGEFARLELQAIAALLHYVNLTQMGARPALRLPKRESCGTMLAIDAATRASLELVRPRTDGAPTVFSAIDRTVTAAGARELMGRLLSPSANAGEINRRLDAVSLFVDDWGLRDRVRTAMKNVPDMARALSRLKLKRSGPRDLGSLRDGLSAANHAGTLLEGVTAMPHDLQFIANAISNIPAGLCSKLQTALVERPPFFTREGGFIVKGYDAALDEARHLASDTKMVIAKLQSDYAAKTGIKSLKIQFNNVFGYFVEVSAGAAMPLLDGVHAGEFRHKQTLANAMRFTTAELADLEHRIAGANVEAQSRESALFNDLAADVLAAETAISQGAAAFAQLDCLAALAELAHTQNYVRPKIDGSRVFLMKGGRHPAVEQSLARDGASFIANDCRLDGDGGQADAILAVTGPNMAGKSTYLRQNALIAVLAQMGSFVPADEAHIGVADRLFARIGAADDLARGRSTFMVEMTETAAILNQATARSLVILDEIGRGTATFDGLSIAWAVLEHLHDVTGCRALIATHYHELTRLAGTLPRAGNVRMAVTEWKDSIVFLHAVEEGAAQRSYGIQAAKLAGVPKPVLARAKQVLAHLEGGAGPDETERGSMLPVLMDLPLFAAPAFHEPQNVLPPHPIFEKLATIDPDALTPREALDLLYELHAQTLTSP